MRRQIVEHLQVLLIIVGYFVSIWLAILVTIKIGVWLHSLVGMLP